MCNRTKDYSKLCSVVSMSVIANCYVRVCMENGEHTECYHCRQEISVKQKL